MNGWWVDEWVGGWVGGGWMNGWVDGWVVGGWIDLIQNSRESSLLTRLCSNPSQPGPPQSTPLSAQTHVRSFKQLHAPKAPFLSNTKHV